MRIGQVVKAKKLRHGDRVLVFDADGKPAWNTVAAVEPQYDPKWLDVSLEGISDDQEIHQDARVVVWK